MHRLYKKQQNQAAAGLYLFLSKRKTGQNLLLLAVKGKDLFPDNACNTSARSQKSSAVLVAKNKNQVPSE